MQAIEFVQMQRDDELWELLISLALADADMIGAPLLRSSERSKLYYPPVSERLSNQITAPELALRDAPHAYWFAGALLDHIGGYVDPLRLVQKIPAGLAIPNLRDRLVHIIADFRTQTSLREGCNTILHHDCLVLAQVELLLFSSIASQIGLEILT